MNDYTPEQIEAGTEVIAHATRTSQGWEISLPGDPVPVGQVRTLDKAPALILDHLDGDAAGTAVIVIPAGTDLAADIRTARTSTREAAAAQEAAARTTRDLVLRLDALGYRSADIAGLLGVSRSRISQLLHEGRAAR